MHERNAAFPLRGDSAGPLNIDGDAEVLTAVCDFLSVTFSRLINSCFQTRSSKMCVTVI